MNVIVSGPLAAGPTADPTSLIQFGVLGVILMLVLFGFLWAKPSVDRLIKDKERAEAQRDALMETFQTQVIPFLSEVKEHVVPGINEMLRKQGELEQAFREFRMRDDLGKGPQQRQV